MTRIWLRRAVGTAALASAVWSINLQLRQPSTTKPFAPEPVTQDASAAADTSLDIEVLATFPHDPVFLVEHRAAPNHRILSFDPRTGEERTVLSMTDKEQVNGLALHPEGDRLAVLYSPDVAIVGMGLSLLDVASGELTTVLEASDDRYLLDPVWDLDGQSVVATQVLLDEDGFPVWSVVRITVADGIVAPLVPNALTPAVGPEGVWFLVPDLDGNGRAIGLLAPDGSVDNVLQASGATTIDHLMRRPDGRLRIAVHEGGRGALTFGAPAAAHVGPSQWWTVDVAAGTAEPEVGLPADTVLDSVTTFAGSVDGALVHLTRQGLWFMGAERVQVLRSRALTFVAG